MEIITENVEIIVGAIVAILAVGIVIKIRSNNNNRVNQKNINTNGGDVVGRDKKS